MIRFLLNRPIGVGMSFLAAVLFSLLALRQLPVSLLPEIEVPEIIVRVSYPGHSAYEVEEQILKPIRASLSTLGQLSSIHSKASANYGTVNLRFEYGLAMNLAYIEINEKIDRLTAQFPRDMPRPEVVRVNTADIPIVRIQVIPQEEQSFTALSELANKTLKKRIEQLQGVSLVDINGLQEEVIYLQAQEEAMRALQVSHQEVVEAIQKNNLELGAIHINEGAYRYYVKVRNTLKSEADIAQLVVKKQGNRLIHLHEVLSVEKKVAEASGYHLSNGQQAVVLKVHKQANAQMNQLMPRIEEAVSHLEKEFPQVRFLLSQDQTQLLRASISNLQSSLLLGGIFAFAVLFFFLGDYRTSLIIGISLPVSFLISFLFFSLFSLSINIISLSGLALGLGMLIDNAIIVLENIKRKQQEGLPLIQACTEGVDEVAGALVSSVLTTLAVFIPLLFLNGMAGVLFYDQALSVAIILGVSLLVAFILLPLIFFLFYKNKEVREEKEPRLYQGMLRIYNWVFEWVWKNKGMASFLLLFLLASGAACWRMLAVEKMPELEKKDWVFRVEWNEAIPLNTSKKRMEYLIERVPFSHFSEADIGISQFLLPDAEQEVQWVYIYFQYTDTGDLRQEREALAARWREHYPLAKITVLESANAFDQLFTSSEAYLEARVRPLREQGQIPLPHLLLFADSLKKSAPAWKAGDGLKAEKMQEIQIDYHKLSVYGISPMAVQDQLNRLFGRQKVSEIKGFGEAIPVLWYAPEKSGQEILQEQFVSQASGGQIRLSEIVQIVPVLHYSYLLADKRGIYHDFVWDDTATQPISAGMEYLQNKAVENGWLTSFEGVYLQAQENLWQLIGIIFLAIALLYFILAAQFESFVQPFIVLFTLPFGLAGSLIFLAASGNTINLMSLIGIVVMLGVMVNDAILKVDTINRLRKEQAERALDELIHEAGRLRLKPIVMTSLTTILALLPILFSSGLGAELQIPLVWAVLGGLSIGTVTALLFVPLGYRWMVRQS